MFLKLIFLFNFLLICESTIYCNYINPNSDAYECLITINNELGSDSFKSIDGPHCPFKTHADVKVVTRSTGVTTIVPQIICSKFTNLKRLNFESFGVTKLISMSFYYCRSLEEINLNNNKITSISSSAFSYTLKLNKLSLKSNDIGQLDYSYFSRLTNLAALTLDHNINLKLTASVFTPLTSLSTLSIRNCSLTQWNFNLFRKLQKLQTLDLDLNLLTEIPLPRVFHPDAPLQRLSIDDNNIRTIQRASFGNLLNLLDLNARNNLIENVDGTIFDAAKNLKNANFENNRCIKKDIYDFGVNRTNNINYFQNCQKMFSEFPMTFHTMGKSVNWRPITEPQVEGLRVSVKAAFDAAIILSTYSLTDGDDIEIILRTSLTNKSYIRENGTICSEPYCTSDIVNIINENEFTDFLINWSTYGSNHSLFVTYANNYIVQIMSIVRKNFFKIEYFGVRTDNTVGEWKVDVIRG